MLGRETFLAFLADVAKKHVSATSALLAELEAQVGYDLRAKFELRLREP